MIASQKSECFLTLPRRVICERINTCEKPMVPQWCWLWCFWWWSLRITMIKTVMVLLMMVMDSQEVLKLFRLALQTIQALQSIRSEMVLSWLPLTLATISHRKWKKKTDVLNKWSWGTWDPCKVLWSFYDWLQQLVFSMPGPSRPGMSLDSSSAPWLQQISHASVTQKNNVDDPPGNKHISPT